MCHHSVCPLKFINNAVVILRVINHTGYLPLPLHHVTLTIGGGHFIPFDPLLSVAYLLFCFVQHRFRFFFFINPTNNLFLLLLRPEATRWSRALFTGKKNRILTLKTIILSFFASKWTRVSKFIRFSHLFVVA